MNAERIQVIVKEKNPGHSQNRNTKFRTKECSKVVNRRLCNEVISQKDQKHMGYSVWSRLGQVAQD